jgi:hypothetical protein
MVNNNKGQRIEMRTDFPKIVKRKSDKIHNGKYLALRSILTKFL